MNKVARGQNHGVSSFESILHILARHGSYLLIKIDASYWIKILEKIFKLTFSKKRNAFLQATTYEVPLCMAYF